MSEQEFIPKSQQQSQAAMDSDDLYAQPYKRAAKSRSSDMPKSEHPSTYDASIPPYSYRAQDSPTFNSQPPPRQQQAQQSNPTGGPFQSGQRPYNHYRARTQKSWIRRQWSKQSITSKIVLAIFALGLLLAVIALISLLILFILLPALFLATLVILLVIFIVLVRTGFFLRRRSRTRYRQRR